MKSSETKSIVKQNSESVFSKWKKSYSDFNNIALLSPFYSQYHFFKEIFPHSRITVFNKKSWNLDVFKEFKFDMISASSVFMYSPNPEKWFSNVLSSCRYFWIHDLIEKKRSEKSILGPDDDKMRYSLSPNFLSSFKGSYDMSSLNEKIIDFRTFSVRENTHFLANIRGNLREVSNTNISFNSAFIDLLFKLKYRWVSFNRY